MDIENVKLQFKDHELTEVVRTSHVKIFDFRKPGDSHLSQRWIIERGTLHVTGDCYCAIYRWGASISLKFLASCDLSYFNEKCEADKDGSGQNTYNAWEHGLTVKTVTPYFHLAALKVAQDKYPDAW